MRIILAILILFQFQARSIAQPAGVLKNEVFDDRIKTVTMFVRGYPFSTPVMQMNTADILLLEFDELSESVSDFRYAVIQCDYNWEPTGNSTFDYIDGFSDGWVSNYDYSFNTTVSYVHYTLQLPNEDFRITQSGNYAVIIYREDVNQPVLTRRFMVAEGRIEIDGYVAVTRNPTYRDRFQEIVFDVLHEGFPITNPYQEINVVVTQNDRWDNALFGIKPLFVQEDRLQFDYNMKIAFPTGREYREMDIRTLRYRTEGVRALDIRDSANIVYLMPDPMRQMEEYSPEGDLNGKFLIDKQEGRDGRVEADYASVVFQLPFDVELSNGTFYVVGAFNEYALGEENKMRYNDFTNAYETAIFLKQGFYNYRYVFVEDGSGTPDLSLTEGNYYDTENDYAIYVYYKPFGQRYDQLIGYTFLNTKLNRY